MTEQEVKKLIYVVTATYPKTYEKFTELDYKNMTAAWAMVLEDYTYQEASIGLKAFLKSDTKGFPPSPGQVIDMIIKLSEPPEDETDTLKVWTQVREAIRDSYYNAEERFKNLPELAQKVIANPGNLRDWGQLPSEEVTSMVQARFIHAYNDAKRQKREMRRLGSNLLIAAQNQKAIGEKP